MKHRTVAILNKSIPSDTAFPPMQTAPSATALTVRSTYSLVRCQHTKMRITKRHNVASALIFQALQKGPCSANQIAYTDIGSVDNLAGGLDLEKTADKTLPSWLLPNHSISNLGCCGGLRWCSGRVWALFVGIPDMHGMHLHWCLELYGVKLFLELCLA